MFQRFPVTKMSQWFTVGQTGELCCHHHNQDYGYSLQAELLVHLNLQGAHVSGWICISVCEMAAQQERVPLRAVAEEEVVQQEKSCWPTSRQGQAAGEAWEWQEALSWDGLVWLLADLATQTGHSHADWLSLSVGHGSLSIPSTSRAAQVPSCHTGPAPVHLLPISTGRACVSWAVLPLCSPCFSCTSFTKKSCCF